MVLLATLHCGLFSNSLAFCIRCEKPYVGRTVTRLNTRMSGHRSGFYKVLEEAKKPNFDPFSFENEFKDDSYTLGLHLYNDHSCKIGPDFNAIFRVFILETCSPSSMEVKEHKYIHTLKSLQPSGLNKSNPFNIPILNI